MPPAYALDARADEGGGIARPARDSADHPTPRRSVLDVMKLSPPDVRRGSHVTPGGSFPGRRGVFCGLPPR